MELTGISRTFIALGIGILLGGGMGYLFLPHLRDYFDKKGTEKRKLVELITAQRKVSVDDAAQYLGIPLTVAEQELHELEIRGVVRRVKNTENDAVYENAAEK